MFKRNKKETKTIVFDSYNYGKTSTGKDISIPHKSQYLYQINYLKNGNRKIIFLITDIKIEENNRDDALRDLMMIAYNMAYLSGKKEYICIYNEFNYIIKLLKDTNQDLVSIHKNKNDESNIETFINFIEKQMSENYNNKTDNLKVIELYRSLDRLVFEYINYTDCKDTDINKYKYSVHKYMDDYDGSIIHVSFNDN